MDGIKEIITSILPDIEDEQLSTISHRLDELGVTKISDLDLVEEGDLTGVMKTIQARLLVRSWKNMENAKEKACYSNLVNNEREKAPETPKKKKISSNMDWALNYTIPWTKLPKEIQKPLEEGKRLVPSMRKKFIRIVTDDIATVVEKPRKNALAIIATEMVAKYPQSLADSFFNEVVGDGHLSILKQMVTRFDNNNRLSPYNVLKRSIKNKNSNTKISTADAYGCINWQPPLLPIGEDEDTQNEKKKIMQEKSSNKIVDAECLEFFKQTYVSQRKDINLKMIIGDLKNTWPILFTEEGLQMHFKTLMDFDADEKINESMSIKSIKIFGFFKTVQGNKKNERKVQEILKENCRGDNPEMSVLLSLIAAYFDEKTEELVLSVDINKTVSDLDIPSTPCLVCYGEDVTNSDAYAITIDSKVMIEEIKTFEAGFNLMFMCFYVFNIQYPKSAAITLEFV